MNAGPGCTTTLAGLAFLRRGGRLALAVGVAALLAACAYSPLHQQPGTARADVVAHLGAPFVALPLPDGGERLVYSTQPAGREVYHVDLDSSGRVTRTEQVLTASRLNAIVLGTWTATDVRNTFGPPMLIDRVHSFDGEVWNYRFLEDINLRRLAHVHIDRAGIVRKVLFTDEPLPGDDRIF